MTYNFELAAKAREISAQFHRDVLGFDSTHVENHLDYLERILEMLNIVKPFEADQAMAKTTMHIGDVIAHLEAGATKNDFLTMAFSEEILNLSASVAAVSHVGFHNDPHHVGGVTLKNRESNDEISWAALAAGFAVRVVRISNALRRNEADAEEQREYLFRNLEDIEIDAVVMSAIRTELSKGLVD